MVIEPSAEEWQRVQYAIRTHERGDFDMEIINKLYGSSALILPHRPYALLTKAFLKHDQEEHAQYLGTRDETWDAQVVLGEAKFVHFSDWPAPKPWVRASVAEMEAVQPECIERDGVRDCGDRDVWSALRRDFRNRRNVRLCPSCAVLD
jgi:hypothetical protein